MTRSTKACVTRALVGWGESDFFREPGGGVDSRTPEASHLLSAFTLSSVYSELDWRLHCASGQKERFGQEAGLLAVLESMRQPPWPPFSSLPSMGSILSKGETN